MTVSPLHLEAMRRSTYQKLGVDEKNIEESFKRRLKIELSPLEKLLLSSTEIMDKYIQQSERKDLKVICDFYINHDASTLIESTLPPDIIKKVTQITEKYLNAKKTARQHLSMFFSDKEVNKAIRDFERTHLDQHKFYLSERLGKELGTLRQEIDTHRLQEVELKDQIHEIAEQSKTVQGRLDVCKSEEKEDLLDVLANEKALVDQRAQQKKENKVKRKALEILYNELLPYYRKIEPEAAALMLGAEHIAFQKKSPQ